MATYITQFMKKKCFLLLVVFVICFVTDGISQKRNYRINNSLNVIGGLTKFTIATDDFITTEGDGFVIGTATGVDIPMRWYNISLGMQISENHVNILGKETALSVENEFIKYKIFAVQAPFLMHIKVIPNMVTIDLGPILQYNGNLELVDKKKETYYINKYNNVTVKAIKNISQFNINGAIGASVGFKYFKLKAQYIYGFTNILKRLDNENLDALGGPSHFKGNQNMLILGGVISF